MSNNLIAKHKFKVTFSSDEYSFLTKNIMNISIPAIGIGLVEAPTTIKMRSLPGDSVDIADIIISFLIDENYENYKTFLQWIKRLKSFTTIDMNNIFIDLTVSLLNSKYNSNIDMVFEDCFPYYISELQLNYQVADHEPSFFDVSFKVNGVKIEDGL